MKSSGRWTDPKILLIDTPYHIILQRSNQVMLSFLQVKAVVNGLNIYPLADSKPVVIQVQENYPRLVITDGYHFTKPLKLLYSDNRVCGFRVTCAISDRQLLGGFVSVALMYLLAIYTDITALKVVSFLPLVFLVCFYYFNRKHFIRLVPLK